MAKYYLTRKAVQDLSRIWNYTFDKWSEEQADLYYAMLLSTCQEIANFPESGKRYDKVVSGILGYKAQRHIIFYRVIPNKAVEILRILHGRMDLKNHLKE